MRKLFRGMALVVALTAGGVMTGCQKPEQLADGYQPGDLTSIAVDAGAELIEARRKYCDEGDEFSRQVLVSAVRAVQSDYPVDGICSDPDVLAKLALAALVKGASDGG